jgi:hypothetical protein
MPNVDWFRGDQLVGAICLVSQEGATPKTQLPFKKLLNIGFDVLV